MTSKLHTRPAGPLPSLLTSASPTWAPVTLELGDGSEEGVEELCIEF